MTTTTNTKATYAVYLVTVGNYEDYRVFGAYLSEEEAKKSSEDLHSSEIEEYQLECAPSQEVFLLWTGQYEESYIYGVYASVEAVKAAAQKVHAPYIEEMKISSPNQL